MLPVVGGRDSCHKGAWFLHYVGVALVFNGRGV